MYSADVSGVSVRTGRGLPGTTGWGRATVAAVGLLCALALCQALGIAAPFSTSPATALGPANSSSVANRGLLGSPLVIGGATFSHVAEPGFGYAIRRDAASGRDIAANLAQRMHVSFADAGITVLSGRARLALGLVQPGRAQPTIHGNRVLYRYNGITEWFVNGPSGLEQGFTITRPRSGNHLTLALKGTGNVTPELTRSGGVVFRGPGHLRYGGLIATDRSGRRLAARLRVVNGRIRISVDTRGARYPLRIDPTVQTGELNSSDDAPGDEFGSSTAVSGSTIVVGASGAGTNQQGLAYLFNASGTQLAELGASDGANGDGFGTSVAVSGSTVVVGAPGADNGDGAIYLFSTSGQQLAEINSPNGSGDSLGSAVAMSGSTIVAGAPGVNGGDGGVFVYNASGSEIGSAVGPSGQGDGVGQSVAISGSTVVAGAPAANNGDGAGFVYTTSGHQTAEIPGPSGQGDGAGQSVAISGSTVVLGATDYNNGQGTAFVYTSSGVQTAQLTAADGVAGDDFGLSVAMSGSTIVVGADQQNAAQGDAYVFTNAGQQTAELTASDGASGDSLGSSAAIAGTTIVLGAPYRNSGGSAYLYNDTLTVNESGSGSVNSTDGQISCPSTCSAGYLPGASVTLIATPAAGSTFAGWSGGGCSGTGPCTETVDGNASVTANFLSDSAPPSASITSPSSGGTYALGQDVPTSFDCSRSEYGPPITSCVDSNGSTATAPNYMGSGSLNTSTAGSRTYSVTATGADGQSSPPATIAYTVVAPPVNSAPPTITGAPAVGSTLTCSGSAWSGATVSASYRWDANGAPIPGATGSIYTVTASDAGATITCVATATNIAGSAAAASAPVLIPAATSAPSTGLTLSGGSVISNTKVRYACVIRPQRSARAARARTSVDRVVARRSNGASRAQTLSRCEVRMLTGRHAIATGTARGRGQRLRVTLTLSSYGLHLLVSDEAGVKVRVDATGMLRTGAVKRASSRAVLSVGRALLIPAAGMFQPNSPALTRSGAAFLVFTAAHVSHADQVVCLGYTAAPGGSLKNTPFSLSLAAQRAQLACQALRRRHVSATYGTEALGKTDPLVPNVTPADLARNRRVEFDVYSRLSLRRG
jgi:hypothetical protein